VEDDNGSVGGVVGEEARDWEEQTVLVKNDDATENGRDGKVAGALTGDVTIIDNAVKLTGVLKLTGIKKGPERGGGLSLTPGTGPSPGFCRTRNSSEKQETDGSLSKAIWIRYSIFPSRPTGVLHIKLPIFGGLKLIAIMSRRTKSSSEGKEGRGDKDCCTVAPVRNRSITSFSLIFGAVISQRMSKSSSAPSNWK